jgi:hypothetical protein
MNITNLTPAMRAEFTRRRQAENKKQSIDAAMISFIVGASTIALLTRIYFLIIN